MGLLSLWPWRKNPTREEQLETIEKEIKSMQELKHDNQQRLRRTVGYFIFYSTLLYVIGAIVLLLFFLPPDWQGKLFATVPLLCVPILIFLIKKTVHWYYVTKITTSDEQLAELRARKKKILSEVMENETYKKAKELLDKYDPDSAKKIVNDETKEGKAKPTLKLSDTELRQRFPQGGPAPYRGQASLGKAPTPPRSGMAPSAQSSSMQMQSMHRPGGSIPPGPPLPRPILPRERSTVERMVEYLVGDGPSQRYALVCKSCWSHNGMAIKEEFEYLPFRCAYCHVFNPPRRARPQPPRIDEVLGAAQSPRRPGSSAASPPSRPEATKQNEEEQGGSEDAGEEDLCMEEPDVKEEAEGAQDCSREEAVAVADTGADDGLCREAKSTSDTPDEGSSTESEKRISPQPEHDSEDQ